MEENYISEIFSEDVRLRIIPKSGKDDIINTSLYGDAVIPCGRCDIREDGSLTELFKVDVREAKAEMRIGSMVEVSNYVIRGYSICTYCTSRTNVKRETI